MRPRAVIFDVYGTLLNLVPIAGDPQAGWQQLLSEYFQTPPPLAGTDFSAACCRIIEQQHGMARSRGILCPEILWPLVVGEALPEMSTLSSMRRDELIFRERQLKHTCVLNRQAAALLPRLRQAGLLLGIASNAQAYTVRELQETFAAAGLNSSEFFERDLCFWSFEHGFSKPDPHVFQILTAKLQVRGISSGEILMIGDRLDNDIAPASAHGWKTWWLTASPKPYTGGDWKALSEFLEV